MHDQLEPAIDAAWEDRASHLARRPAARSATRSRRRSTRSTPARCGWPSGRRTARGRSTSGPRRRCCWRSACSDMALQAGAPQGGAWWDKVDSKFDGLGREPTGARRAFAPCRAPSCGGRPTSRRGAVLMPSFVNVGAYVGEGTMVDTWATVGSCAQIGANVHLSGGVGIGGVLEPMQAGPDDHRGQLLHRRPVRGGRGLHRPRGLGARHGRVHRPVDQDRRPRDRRGHLRRGAALFGGGGGLDAVVRAACQLYCAVIVKRVDARTRSKTGDQRAAAGLTPPAAQRPREGVGEVALAEGLWHVGLARELLGHARGAVAGGEGEGDAPLAQGAGDRDRGLGAEVDVEHREVDAARARAGRAPGRCGRRGRPPRRPSRSGGPRSAWRRSSRPRPRGCAGPPSGPPRSVVPAMSVVLPCRPDGPDLGRWRRGRERGLSARPIRGSVPARRRAMLARWRQATRSARRTQRIATSPRPRSAASTGDQSAAISAASEEKRESAAVASQIEAGRDPHRPGEREEEAEEGRDPLAAPEPQPDREAVPEQGRERRRLRRALARRPSGASSTATAPLPPSSSSVASGRALVAGAQDVGGADVARADGAHVAEAHRAGDEDPEGHRAQQVAEERPEEQAGQERQVRPRASKTRAPPTQVPRTRPCRRAPSKGVFLRLGAERGAVEHEGGVGVEEDEVGGRARARAARWAGRGGARG